MHAKNKKLQQNYTAHISEPVKAQCFQRGKFTKKWSLMYQSSGWATLTSKPLNYLRLAYLSKNECMANRKLKIHTWCGLSSGTNPSTLELISFIIYWLQASIWTREWRIQACKCFRTINHSHVKERMWKKTFYMRTAATGKKLTKQNNWAGYVFVTESVAPLCPPYYILILAWRGRGFLTFKVKTLILPLDVLICRLRPTRSRPMGVLCEKVSGRNLAETALYGGTLCAGTGGRVTGYQGNRKIQY